MDKRFKPAMVEADIFQLWLKHKTFSPQKTGKPFCIVMPPPNANGSLHVGHALFVTLEDIMTRLARMGGYNSLLLPGTDHAGILTQVVFERRLAKKGLTRFDLGRKKFFQACLEFTLKQKANIINQFKTLGASADWDRERFTLDPDISQVVLETFVKLYQDGLIYRGERIINWCPRCQTVLSDLEVEHQEHQGQLYYIKYPIKGKPNHFITVATTRPETMLGDTAVAVNPADKRYRSLIGQEVKLPLVDRLIPIIADKRVDMEFGTGAVKVTPAHDGLDFDIGQDHKLPWIQVIGFDNHLTQAAGRFSGLPVSTARQAVITQLKKLSLLAKVEDYQHNIGHCERCKTVVEPMISTQWWVKVKPLAQPAIKAVKQGKIKFIPNRFNKLYLDWMTNLKDWCISRQLWWGHQIPVYYCGTKGLSKLQLSMNPELKKYPSGCGRVIVSTKAPDKCPDCGNPELIHDPDTLDTWFSSGQWPLTALGFNYQKPGEDFTTFYPTTIMETGYDILYLWVARMIMFGLYMDGRVPFKYVYLHGLVRDHKGQKMSKSKGNVIDPLEVIKQYGTDALRFALVAGTGQGEAVNVGPPKFKAGQYLTNKLWNASRFIWLMVEKTNLTPGQFNPSKTNPHRSIWQEHQAFLNRFESLINKFRYGQALEQLRWQFWHVFCDQVIEQLKDKAYQQDKAAVDLLTSLLADYLALFHPFIPFVTEAIWQQFNQHPRFKAVFTSQVLAQHPYPVKVNFEV